MSRNVVIIFAADLEIESTLPGNIWSIIIKTVCRMRELILSIGTVVQQSQFGKASSILSEVIDGKLAGLLC